MKFLIVLSLIALAASAKVSKPRIVGGEAARAGQFAYAAAITATSASFTHFCGGALIHEQFVITAAQCVVAANSFTIQLGSNNLMGTDINRLTVATSTKIVHPDFDSATLSNDIALLKLHQPITLTDYIKVISLPTSTLGDNMAVTIMGWGQIDDTHPGVSNDLQYVVLTSISNDECKITYGNQLQDSMVCFAGNFNEGSCLDDTGSPAVTTFFGLHWLTAISTFYSGNGCESTDPAGYTRVFNYVDWIKDQLQSE